MAYPDLRPVSTSSKSILPATGSYQNVTSASLPFGIYLNTDYWTNDQIDLFKRGAVEEVAFVYKKLGGDVLDIELVDTQVYSAYEEAVLEYSYTMNLHQSKNVLSRFLGGKTGSFDSNGQLTGSDIDPSVHPELKYPSWTIGYARRVSEGISGIANLNGNETVYSGSFNMVPMQQDYDLQAAVENNPEFSSKVNGKKVLVKKVYYKTQAAGWYFYGYFGGLNVVGNLSTYGQYADDSTFEIIPVWQNKLQAMAYKDAIKTRVSDYSFQLKNNKLRIFPTPNSSSPIKFWFEFVIPSDAWEEQADGTNSGVDGVNNLNTLPFQNIPYNNINSVGKQWIRRYALSICKEMLGYIRSKFDSIPIPGEKVSLNGKDLITSAQAEMKELKAELTKILDETTYDKLLERDVSVSDSTTKLTNQVPNLIYIG